MVILRRNTERRYIESGSYKMWQTFYPSVNSEKPTEGFGNIVILNEYILLPDKDIQTEMIHGTELVAYVHNGTLALEGPERHSGVIIAGEFQSMTVLQEQYLRTRNTSAAESAHLFRIYLRIPHSRSETDQNIMQTRITTAQRHNTLCTVASPDSKNGVLHLTTNTLIYSSILKPGHHIVYELQKGRKIWLHIVSGKVTVDRIDLSGGDGMGLSDDTSLSLTAGEHAEILLIDTQFDDRESQQEGAGRETGNIKQ